MIVFLSSWLLQSKALSSDNVNPSAGQPDLKKNELFSTHGVVYVIHIFCMVVLWRVKRKKLQTNWKSIKIACGAVSASHRQLRAYSPLECVKVKVKTDNNYVDVSGSTQHEIYRWVVHIYPRISGDYHEFQRVLLAVSHILLNRDAETHKSRKFFC